MAEMCLVSQAGGVHLLALLGGAIYAQSQLHALLDSSLQGSVDGEAGGLWPLQGLSANSS